MEDLERQIGQILSDPQSMQKLQSMAAALGLGGPAQPQPEPQAPVGARSAPEAAAASVTPELLQTVTRMAPLLSKVSQEDDSTRLLLALRPLLGPARRQKLDEAVKILRIMRLLPLLKDSGVFSGLLSGLI